jgi:hypothetical protein
LSAIEEAQLSWLALAGLLQLVAALAPVALWHAGFDGICLRRAFAFYGTGSLANSFLPGRAGGALRLTLFAGALPAGGRVRSCARSLASIAVARQIVLLVLVGSGLATSRGAPWLVAVPVVWLGGAALVCRRLGGRVDLRLVAWAGIAALARAGALVAVLAALGVANPLLLAAEAVLALELAAIFPLLPGNLGASVALAWALGAQGVPPQTAVAAGILVHSLETLVGLAFGGAACAALVRLGGERVPVLSWPLRGEVRTVKLEAC